MHRNVFAGQGIADRFEVLAELIDDRQHGSLYLGHDALRSTNVYLRVTSGIANAPDLDRCRTLDDARIVTPADWGSLGERCYYVVPFEADLGKTRSLHTLLEEHKELPVARALSIICQLCTALAHAAEHGLSHGSLHPKAVLLAADARLGEVAKLWDFGILRPADCYAARYAAPERLAGQPPDVRSDIYSLGAILYQMLAGRLPIVAVTDDLESWRNAHARGSVRPLGEVRPQLPEALVALVMRCLHKDPQRRPQRLAELTQVCVRPRQQGASAATEVPRALWPVAGLGALVALGAAWWLLRPISPITTTAAVPKPARPAVARPQSAVSRPVAPLPLPAPKPVRPAAVLPQPAPTPVKQPAGPPIARKVVPSRPSSTRRPAAAPVLRAAPVPLAVSEQVPQFKAAPDPLSQP